MTRKILSPEECLSMTDVRAGVDALDAQLVDMLATRFGYMRAAARIKPERSQVRDEARKAEVIGNASARAQDLGLPATAIAEIWDRLVEASISYEMTHWDSLRG